MDTGLKLDFIWIPTSLGGHSGEPYEGMRTTIRWQKHLDEFLECARDVQWEKITFDFRSSQGQAICKLSSANSVPDDWLEDGELVEMLNGFRVLAIGRIVKKDLTGHP